MIGGKIAAYWPSLALCGAPRRRNCCRADVETHDDYDRAVPHQMDEEAVQWFDPQEGIKDGS